MPLFPISHSMPTKCIYDLRTFQNRMPALDINMIESLSRELHPPHTNLMAETEVGHHV